MTTKRITIDFDCDKARSCELNVKFRDQDHFEGFSDPDGLNSYIGVWEDWQDVEEIIGDLILTQVKKAVDISNTESIDLDFTIEEPDPYYMKIAVECENLGSLRCFKLNICFKNEEQYVRIAWNSYFHEIDLQLQDTINELHGNDWCLTGLTEPVEEIDEDEPIDLDVSMLE